MSRQFRSSWLEYTSKIITHHPIEPYSNSLSPLTIKSSKKFPVEKCAFYPILGFKRSHGNPGLALRHLYKAPVNFMISVTVIIYYLVSSVFSVISFEIVTGLLWTFFGPSSLYLTFPRYMHRRPWRFLPVGCTAPSESSRCTGTVHLPAVPSGSTRWGPCLRKPGLGPSAPEVYWPRFQAPVIKLPSSCQGPRQMAEALGLGSTVWGWTQGRWAVGTPGHFQMLPLFTQPCSAFDFDFSGEYFPSTVPTLRMEDEDV